MINDDRETKLTTSVGLSLYPFAAVPLKLLDDYEAKQWVEQHDANLALDYVGNDDQELDQHLHNDYQDDQDNQDLDQDEDQEFKQADQPAHVLRNNKGMMMLLVDTSVWYLCHSLAVCGALEVLTFFSDSEVAHYFTDSAAFLCLLEQCTT